MKREAIRVEPISSYLAKQNVMKCNIYCTSAKHFATVNAIYARYFPSDPPARIFVCVPEWTGPFDIEIDCVAVV
jgi:2-iminobutanoate/2-iminopropanoate deaminase